jgi:putative acetyltransferase
VIVGPADPFAPGPRALLAQSRTLMAGLFPAEENHVLGADALAAPDIRFVAATEDGQTPGIGALALRNGYGEVKAMFTAPEARKRGVADAVLRHLIDLSAREDRPVLRLETGRGLEAAQRLYRRHGFAPCEPFGDYTANDASLFLERAP